MRKGLTSIGDLLEAKNKRGVLQKTVAVAQLSRAWDEHMRGDFTTASAVSYYKDGIVHITVEEPVWAQQMQMLKTEILEKFGTFCDTSEVRELKFSCYGSATVRRPLKQGKKRSESAWPNRTELLMLRVGGAGEHIDQALARSLPESLKGVYELHILQKEHALRNLWGDCGICGVKVPGNAHFCQACGLFPMSRLIADAVSFLMESPLSGNDDIAEVSGIGENDRALTHELISKARDAAGRRLLDEALGEARKDKEGNYARIKPLLTASICASTGKSPDEVRSEGLESHLSYAVLRAAGYRFEDDAEG